MTGGTIKYTLAVFLAGLAPVAAHAQQAAAVASSPTAAAPSAPAPSSPALELAKLYLQEDLVVDQATENFDKSFNIGFESNQSSKDLESNFPGIRQAALDAGHKVFVSEYISAIPLWRVDLARFIDTNFSTTETNAMIGYFQSPAGAKATKVMSEGGDISALAKKYSANPDNIKIEAEDANSLVNIGNLSKLSQAELTEVMKFFMTPAGRKFTRLSPQLQTILLNEVNNAIAALMPKAQSAIVEAISGYIANFDKTTSEHKRAPAGSSTL
jgi:hypothetical protein